MQHKKAFEAITTARSILVIDHPFFGCLVLQLKLVEAPWIPTMATDGIHLLYNPEFTLGLSEHERIGVLAHESYHCAYGHHVRMGDRDHDGWNRACDYVINSDLTKQGFKLPSFALLDPKYDGMSAEDIYAQLPREKKPKDGQGQPQDGKGSGKGQPSQGQSGKGQKPDSSQGPAEGSGLPSDAPDPGKMGGVFAPGQGWDKNKIEAEAAKWEAITRMAVSVAKAQNAGTIPGFLDRLVKDLERPRVPWEQILRRFIDESLVKTYSWMRPNKRFLHTGLVLPGYVSDSVSHIVSVMDTSGSITDKLVEQYAAEKRALLDEGLADKLTVIYADTKVQNVQTFERGDVVQLDPKGGGGTNFRPVMDYIQEHCSDATVILFFTDLMTSDFGDDPNIPVLWTVYGPTPRYERVSDNVPFGDTIHVH